MCREIPWQPIATEIYTQISYTNVIACAQFGDNWLLSLFLHYGSPKCPSSIKTGVTITTASTIAYGRYDIDRSLNLPHNIPIQETYAAAMLLICIAIETRITGVVLTDHGVATPTFDATRYVEALDNAL